MLFRHRGAEQRCPSAFDLYLGGGNAYAASKTNYATVAQTARTSFQRTVDTVEASPLNGPCIFRRVMLLWTLLQQRVEL